MPGKVNPVISESLIQVSLWVIGADVAVTLGGLQSFFELNVAMPLIGAQMLESVHLMATGARNFADAGVKGIEADRERCLSLIEQSLAMRGDKQVPHATVFGQNATLHPTARFQTIHHATDGGCVKANARRQTALIDARLRRDRVERGKLHRCDAAVLRFFHEHAHRDLLQTADVVAGQITQHQRMGLRT